MVGAEMGSGLSDKPSGHANRKRAAEEEAEAEENQKRRKAKGSPAKKRQRLGAAPIGDATAAVAYAADALLIVLSEVMGDEEITAEKRWRYVKEIASAIGMTHSKALMQSRLKKLQQSDEPEHDEELEPNPFLSGATPTG
jgi:hypothetical protein